MLGGLLGGIGNFVGGLFGGGGGGGGSNYGSVNTSTGQTYSNAGFTNYQGVSPSWVQSLLKNYTYGTGGPSSSAAQNALGNQQTQQFINSLTGLANQEQGFAQTPLTGGQSQYQAGLAGTLTPAQQALTNFTLGQNVLGTNNQYGNLGLGGSTMQSQDQAANRLASLAQQEQIDFQNQQMGLAAMGLGSQMLGESGQLTNAAGGLNINQQQANQAMTNANNALFQNLLKMLVGSAGTGNTGTSFGNQFSRNTGTGTSPGGLMNPGGPLNPGGNPITGLGNYGGGSTYANTPVSPGIPALGYGGLNPSGGSVSYGNVGASAPGIPALGLGGFNYGAGGY
jgi:hypothetical protein